MCVRVRTLVHMGRSIMYEKLMYLSCQAMVAEKKNAVK